MPSLLGIIYISEALLEIDASQLYELTEFARKNNHDLGVTGFLYVEDGYFLQYIEGDPRTVNSLLTKISQDDRHEVIHKHRMQVIERRFPIWNMQYVDPIQAQHIRIEKLMIDTLELMKDPEVLNRPHKESLIIRMLDRLAANREKLSVS